MLTNFILIVWECVVFVAAIKQRLPQVTDWSCGGDKYTFIWARQPCDITFGIPRWCVCVCVHVSDITLQD